MPINFLVGKRLIKFLNSGWEDMNVKTLIDCYQFFFGPRLYTNEQWKNTTLLRNVYPPAQSINCVYAFPFCFHFPMINETGLKKMKCCFRWMRLCGTKLSEMWKTDGSTSAVAGTLISMITSTKRTSKHPLKIH